MNDMDLSKNVLPVFVTPVVNYLWPDSEKLNEELRETILELEQTSEGVSKSNVGGWHSQQNFLTHDLAPVTEFRERLSQFSEKLLHEFSRPGVEFTFRIDSWANVLRHGQYHSVHSHPNAVWSGVYYLTDNEKLEEQPLSGRLELLDPRPGTHLTYADTSNLYGRFLLNPNAGQIIVFPSWMQHLVHPYFGDGERISIAFNILL
jgi:uncharacterized protein (TIGR02466 family)